MMTILEATARNFIESRLANSMFGITVVVLLLVTLVSLTVYDLLHITFTMLNQLK
jgi:hypothetical protein